VEHINVRFIKLIEITALYASANVFMSTSETVVNLILTSL